MCTAGDHDDFVLPYECALDHYLDPVRLSTSPYAHRERSFFDNPRTPKDLQSNTTLVVVCEPGEACQTSSREVVVQKGGTLSQLEGQLRLHPARVLHFADVEHSFGSFGSAATGGVQHDIRMFHDDAQVTIVLIILVSPIMRDTIVGSIN